ncbi:MAG: protein kinase domain-containing protein, partial [Thermodesulfobacteriota bacterium]
PFFQTAQSQEGIADDNSKFLKFLSPELISSFLQNLSYKHVPAGQRFIRQGEMIDRAYIIEQGSCLVLGEREGELHPVRHLGPGDIVGELSLLTGEPQNAHVEAQTAMRLWVLPKDRFEDLSQREPAVLDFLTELVSERFNCKRPTAERIIGKYVAKEVLGSGGYSLVFKGYHQDLGLPAAIKMLRHDLALRPDFQAGFWNEARTVAKFNHEHIVKIFDIEEMYRTIFIIMELVEGESLKEVLCRSRTIPPLQAARFLVQISKGLEYAHERGILHLDVNPSNLLLQRGDSIKIMDFGMACQCGADDRGIFDGTVFYMAPEQIDVEPVDQRTDIYSLGITAYELVTGSRPFPEEDVRSVMEAHRYRELPDPGKLVSGLPGELKRIIAKACRKEPGRRYQHMGAFRRDLLALIDDLEGGTPGVKSGHPLETLRQEHDLIRQFLDKLAIASEMLERGEKPAKRFFQAALGFYRLFTGRFHHFKEEEVLFTRLALKDRGGLDAEIRGLQYQHQRGREIMAEVREIVRESVSDRDIPEILEKVSAYISLMRYHIHLEEYIIFPLIMQTCTRNEFEAVREVFEQEDERLGGRVFERGEELIREMGSLLAGF